MSQRMLDAAHAEVWVALDVPSIDAALDAVQDLRKANRPFGIKIGLELITAEGCRVSCLRYGVCLYSLTVNFSIYQRPSPGPRKLWGGFIPRSSTCMPAVACG